MKSPLDAPKQQPPLKVKQPEPPAEPIGAEVLAQAIVDVAAAMKKLNESRLTRLALLARPRGAQARQEPHRPGSAGAGRGPVELPAGGRVVRGGTLMADAAPAIDKDVRISVPAAYPGGCALSRTVLPDAEHYTIDMAFCPGRLEAMTVAQLDRFLEDVRVKVKTEFLLERQRRGLLND